MALSIYATTCKGRLDPQEELDFTVSLASVMAVDEEISPTFGVVVRPEAALLGLKLLDNADGRPDPARTEGNKSLQLWFGIDDAYQNDPAFDNTGTKLGFEVFFTTTQTRIRNRTYLIEVAQL